jgi:hypothetical protein
MRITSAGSLATLGALAAAAFLSAQAVAKQTTQNARKAKSWTKSFTVTLRKQAPKYGPGFGHNPQIRDYQAVDPVSRDEIRAANRNVLQDLGFGFGPAPILTVELPSFDPRAVGKQDSFWTDIAEMDQEFLSRFKIRDIGVIVKHPSSPPTLYGLQISARWAVDGAKEDIQMDSLYGVRPKLGTRDEPETRVHLELAAILYERGTKSDWSEFLGGYDCKPILDQLSGQMKGSLGRAAGER